MPKAWDRWEVLAHYAIEQVEAVRLVASRL